MWRFIKEGEGKMIKKIVLGGFQIETSIALFFKSLVSSHTTKTPLQDKLLFSVEARSRIQPDLSFKQ